MQCREIRQNLSAYMDGQLEPAWLEAVSAHVGECRECRMELQELEETTAIVQSLPELSPPADFKDRLHRKIAAGAGDETGGTRASRFLSAKAVRVAAIAAAVVLVAGTAVLWSALPGYHIVDRAGNLAQESAPVRDEMASSTVKDGLGGGTGEELPDPDAVVSSGPIPQAKGSGEEVRQFSTLQREDAPELGFEEGGEKAPAPESTSPGEVRIMAVPPAGDDVPEGKDTAQLFTGTGGAGTAAVPGEQETEPKKVSVLELALQIDNPGAVREIILNTIEKHGGILLEETETSVKAGFRREEFDRSLAEVKAAGKELYLRRSKRDLTAEYQKALLDLRRFTGEREELAGREELSAAEEERLREVENNIVESRKTLRKLEAMTELQVLQVDLVPPGR